MYQIFELPNYFGSRLFRVKLYQSIYNLITNTCRFSYYILAISCSPNSTLSNEYIFYNLLKYSIFTLQTLLFTFKTKLEAATVYYCKL